MEKLKITKKYLRIIKIVLVAVVFVVALPASVLADDIYPTNDTYVDWNIFSDPYTSASNYTPFTLDSSVYGGSNLDLPNYVMDSSVYGGDNSFDFSSYDPFTINSSVYGGSNLDLPNYVMNSSVYGGSDLSSGSNYALNSAVNGGSNLISGSNYALNSSVYGGSNLDLPNYVMNSSVYGGSDLSSGSNYALNSAVNGGSNILTSSGEYALNNPVDGGSNILTSSGEYALNDPVYGGSNNQVLASNNLGVNSQNYYGSNSYNLGYYPFSSGMGYYSGSRNYSGLSGTYVSSSTYVPGSSVTYSGSYYGGNYVLPATYYAPLASTLAYTNSGVGLTSQVIPNQVLAYTDTNPGLDSVYLSDVPNTGFEDYYRSIIFISLLLSWSATLAYILLRKKIKSSQVIPVAVSSSKTEADMKENDINTTLLDKINSDNTDISKVEEYARTNKILLSSDAAIKIVKLSRLGKINASEYIRGISTGDWIAIGESQIM